jgi:succinate dehydrogenase/fumarate reductase flavoprotein subunit
MNAQMEGARRSAVWDQEVDVLVIGSGAAGMTAALVSALEGARTLLCEKASVLGGTSALSGGTIWIPGSTQTNQSGLPDTKEDGLRFLKAEVPFKSNEDLQHAYIYTGPEAIDYLEQRSEVKFYAVANHPDYVVQPGYALGGRPLAPMPFDGRLLGRDFDLLRSPLRVWTILGGMMVAREDLPHLMQATKRLKSFLYSAKLVLRYRMDRLRYKRGTRLVLGNALAARLLYSLRKANCEIKVKAALKGLLVDGDGVAGAIVTVDGVDRRIRAQKAVVLAAGGFPQSPEWRKRLMPESFATQPSIAIKENTGDSLTAATPIGAAVNTEHDAPAFLVPQSIMHNEDGVIDRWLHSWDRAKPGQIAVNRAGKRFANEAQSYHKFCQEMQKAGAIPAFLVCDAAHLKKWGYGLIRPGERNLKRYIDNGYLKFGATIEALAQAIKIDRNALNDTVRGFNKACESGIDADFHRGESPVDKINGDPLNKPNPCMGPLKAAPFYAIEIWPGDIGTSIGLKTTIDAQVVDESNRPIRGLYACGNDMSSVMRGHYPGPGITLGPGVVFGYRAARHATKTNVNA